MRIGIDRRIPCLLLLTALVGSGVATGQVAGPPETRLIQFVLLEAGTTAAERGEALPDNVRPAIDDVRQFLPFKSYRMLDVALVRTNRVARTSLRGPGGFEYQVRATLVADPPDGRMRVADFDVVRIVRDSAGPDGNVPIRAEEVISTAFVAEPGKTVVVGTSRLNGGETALVVLFTAVQ